MTTLEVPERNDDMEVQSSFDFGNDDIDIDLGLGDVDMEHDGGDLVLHDVDNEQGTGQPAIGSLDDLMGDDSHPVDTDVDVDVLDVAIDIGHDSHEDDLIDYSDDEEVVVQPEASTAAPHGDNTPITSLGDPKAGGEPENERKTDDFAGEYDYDEGVEDYDQNEPYHPTENNDESEHDQGVEQTWNENWEQHTEDEPVVPNSYEDDTPANVEDDVEGQEHGAYYGGEEYDEASYAHAEEGDVDAQHDDAFDQATDLSESKELHSEEDAADGSYDWEHSGVDASQERPLPPIKVNYDGQEMFLFQPNGDETFILDDESLASELLHSTFQALRDHLGSDVSVGTEIGFKFPQLEGISLYEDTFVGTQLRLTGFINIYLALHEQDNNTSPDPLEVIILFRQRPLSHYNRLCKAVEAGVGFSGLAEYRSPDEQKMGVVEGSIDPLTNNNNDHMELPEEVTGPDAAPVEEDEDEGVAKVEDGQLPKAEQSPAQEILTEGEVQIHTTSVTNAEASTNEASTNVDDIDYSDDEDDLNQAGRQVLQAASSGSSTVQGEKAVSQRVEEDNNDDVATFDEDFEPDIFGDGDDDVVNEQDFAFHDDEYFDNDGNNQDYGFDDEYVDKDNFDEKGNLGLAGHVVAGPEVTADHGDVPSVGTTGEETHDGNDAADAFLDFSDADVNDGVSERAGVMTVAAASAGSNVGQGTTSGLDIADSPQGTKRPHDDSVNDESVGKRAKV
ncbi:hypothetical protein EJ04DRAFT_130909 [Polyplosphaeria fusca]|uniref:Uncharacterized protein n=1 Tax=Polyplosphaeria fusca TaxID=682080 RepID=A0A9P4V6B4_9PLEO|nr:hypothetical protein EJ04DRAFT_130909 [Polyplosphaeria fusca]